MTTSSVEVRGQCGALRPVPAPISTTRPVARGEEPPAAPRHAGALGQPEDRVVEDAHEDAVPGAPARARPGAAWCSACVVMGRGSSRRVRPPSADRLRCVLRVLISVGMDDSRSPAERLLDKDRDPDDAGRALSRHARQYQRTLEGYLQAGHRPRWMERIGEIDYGVARERRRLQRAYESLRAECGNDPRRVRAALARDRRGLAVRRPQPADRAAQRVVPDRTPAPDGPADARLRPDPRPVVPARAARRGMDPRGVPGVMTSPGALLAGRYRVARQIGSGGMGVVYLARDETLDRDVAVKVVHAEPESDLGRRIMREARLGAGLRHPHLVTVYDVVPEGGALLLVMEYVDGHTLADELRRGADRPRSRARDPLCRRRGARPRARAGDRPPRRQARERPARRGRRGEARRPRDRDGRDSTRITRTGGMLGTVAYMAPEQAEPGPATAAADVYALAAVAFEVLTGRRAYPGASAFEVMERLRAGAGRPIRARSAPDLPEAAARRGAEGDGDGPRRPPSSAGAFVADLTAALAPAPGEGDFGPPPREEAATATAEWAPVAEPERAHGRRVAARRSVAGGRGAAADGGGGAAAQAARPPGAPRVPRPRRRGRSPSRPVAATTTPSAPPARTRPPPEDDGGVADEAGGLWSVDPRRGRPGLL